MSVREHWINVRVNPEELARIREMCIRDSSNFEGGKIRIYALYQQQGDAKERAAFLKAEYGLGGHSYTCLLYTSRCV